MTTIGFVAAMPLESNALLRLVKDSTRVIIGPYRGFRFELARKTCILVTSGMGIHRAADATRSLLAEYNPQMIMSFGIAGAVESDLEIGDVGAIESFCQLESGVPGPQQALVSLPDDAKDAILQSMSERGARFFTGTAITTSGTQLHGYKPDALTHPVLEMETAGIAQATAENKIPLLALRAISDGPRAPIPFDLGEIMDADANLHTGKMLKAVIRNPKILLQSSQTMRNSLLAANNAAAAVVAALSQVSI